jgi:hypothetical protein
VVRLKNIAKPGFPEFTRHIWQHNETALVNSGSYHRDTVCQLVYWKDSDWIGKNVPSAVLRRVPGGYIAPATHCGWTNQAVLFERRWFMETFASCLHALVMSKFENYTCSAREYQQHNAFEIACRWEMSGCSFGSRGWSVFLSDGLFSHRDYEKYPYAFDLE